MAELRRLQKERRQGFRLVEDVGSDRLPEQAKSKDERSRRINPPGSAGVSPALLRQTDPNQESAENNRIAASPAEKVHMTSELPAEEDADGTSALSAEESNRPRNCLAREGNAGRADIIQSEEENADSPVLLAESPSHKNSPIQAS